MPDSHEQDSVFSQHGLVSAEDFVKDPALLLDRVIDSKGLAFIGREGKIVAALAPLSMSEVVSGVFINDAKFRQSLADAEDALAFGDARPTDEALGET